MPTSSSDPAPTVARTKGGKGRGPSLTGGPIEGSAYAIVDAGAFLVAGLEDRGVLASDDGGTHWRPMNDGLPPHSSVNAIAVAPRDGRLIVLASGGIFSALPRLPLTWTRWGMPLPRGTNPQAVVVWPPSARTLLVGDGSGALYASMGGRAGWHASDTGLPVGRAAISTLRAVHGTLFAGLSGGLASSADGAVWRLDAALGGRVVDDLTALPKGGVAAALDSNGLAVRAGSAATWTLYPPSALGLRDAARVLSVAYDAESHVLVIGTLANGVLALQGLSPPARAFGGVPRDDPVNDLLPTANGLLVAANSGILNLHLDRTARQSGH